MSNINQQTSSECSHLWKISNYSAVMKRPKEIERSVKFSATNDDINWCLEHRVRQFEDAKYMFAALRLRPHCQDVLRKFESVSGSVDVSVIEPGTGRSTRTEGSTFTFKWRDDIDDEELKFGIDLPGIDIDEVKRYILDDELWIRCNLIYFKKNGFSESSSLNNLNFAKISECRVLKDLEKCLIDDHFRDVTISVKGKQYRAHKMILASRSSVFDKMLKVDMSENKNNYIDIADMEQETFEEMLYYIYTGKVKNLDELAFELLPAADRFDLEELRIVCEAVLLEKLSTNNAVKILILADMHRAEELKMHTLRFIKENFKSCEELNDTEFLKNLAASNAQLLKEMMSAFCNK